MHVLIIGGAGMVGRKLLARLAKEGSLNGKAIEKVTLHDVVAAENAAGAAVSGSRSLCLIYRCLGKQPNWLPGGPM